MRCHLQHSLTASVHWHGVLFVSFVCLRNITSSVEYAVANKRLVCWTVVHSQVLGIIFNVIKFLKAESELGTREKWMKEGLPLLPLLHSPPTKRCIAYKLSILLHVELICRHAQPWKRHWDDSKNVTSPSVINWW